MSLTAQFSKWFRSVTSGIKRRARNKTVIIFDKDGTLIDVHSQWAPWIRGIVTSMMSRTDLIISDKAFTKVGFDDGAGRILPGVLGEGTLEMVQECLSEVLQEEGMSPCEADKVVRECIEEGGARFGETKPIGDVTSMFKRLKHSGFQIAINTSDSREATLDNLHRLGVSKLVDIAVCGDDDWMIAKPHPLSAFMICAQLGVQPENAVMVGDSPCDVRLGINAQLGCSIGVLTGIADRKALEGDAHCVVDDVSVATDLILSGVGNILQREAAEAVEPSCTRDSIVVSS
ncbi:phosphoglycolate phosphatase-like [Asterias rubens]|uniref:phosphoglycolate phosphatase-like n=1 Tax=Asterias rubens TaxID=7604 RepID=UPI001454E74E|nr:phosphoglycolate phosphatase-like [Asterias rubens]